MATYILLMNWTEQGIRNVEQSPDRIDAGRALAKQLGGEVRKVYMTMGAHDLMVILDLPTDEAAARFALTIGKAGNVRTVTMKAFPESAYRKLTGGTGGKKRKG